MLKNLILSFVILTTASAFALETDSVWHNNQWRNYLIHFPPNFDTNNALPMVLNFHGFGSNSGQQYAYAEMYAVADTSNFILVCPNAVIQPNYQNFWDVGFNGYYAGLDDIGFTEKIIDQMYHKYNIDLSRVYSCGMSNGGFFSYTLACELNDRIAAIASVTGSMTPLQLSNCSPGKSVPVLQIHGTDDPTVPFGPTSNFEGIESLVEWWASINVCNVDSITTFDYPDIDTNDGSTAQRITYNDCDKPTELIVVDGGGHTWPGVFLQIGATNKDFHASQEIWRFFQQFQLDNPTPAGPVSTEDISQLLNVKIAPNPINDNFKIITEEKINLVQIFDATQNLIFEGSFQSNINTADFAKGIYFLKFQLQNGKFGVKKLVKM